MFNKSKITMGCRRYEARLEDYLQGIPNSELHEHLAECANCRTALENSRLAGDLIRDTWEPARESREAFLAGVLAKIREENARAESPAVFWSPLEFLASRLSLTAAVLLLGLSVYLMGFAPRRTPPAVSDRTELSATDFPQPPGDPDSYEDVLQSLGERRYGR